MKKSLLRYVGVLMLVLISACGPAPEPTLSAEDFASTALANAYTQVAMTQAAIPTATPIPPTLTPTFTPLPTSPPLPTSVPVTATAMTDPCEGVPPVEPQGDTGRVKLVNKSKGQVNLSFGMYQANSLGECGTYSFSLGIFDAPTVTVLAGCYWGYAWITGNAPSIAKTINAICVGSGATISVTIGTEVISPD
ncbi:MAG TPA: hypothetical protein VGJ22_09535 [Anaerolineales bacterium]